MFDLVKAFFTDQQMNRIAGTNLPGSVATWATADSVKSVMVARTVESDVEILPSCVVKLDVSSDGKKRVALCGADDKPYGIVIYSPKSYVHTVNKNNIMDVARGSHIEMNVAFKTAVNAGDAVYWDPTDGLYTTEEDGTVKVGEAVQTITTAVATGAMAMIEVQMPTV